MVGDTSSFMSEKSFTELYSFENRISSVQDLTFDYLRFKFDEKLLPLTDECMESLRIRRNGEYTQLGYMLSDQCSHSIKAAAFADDSKTEFIDRNEITGSVLKQIDDVLAFILRYNRTSSVIKGIYRGDRKNFPEATVREAITDAVMHRDYSSDDPMLVSVFPKKMTVVSPGGTDGYYTSEELTEGVLPPRNRNLAAVLHKLKLIEVCDTDIPHIFSSYGGLSVKPVIRVSRALFAVILPAVNEGAESDLTAFLEENKRFTRREMETELGMNKSEAVSTLNGLIKIGAVVRIGQGRSVRYEVIRP